MPGMTIGPIALRPVRHEDAPAWEALRRALWPDGAADHAAEIAQYLDGKAREPLAAWLAFSADGAAIGFVELSIRQHAEGCASGRILYLEGWYVAPGWRRQGVGDTLIRAAEAWGRAQGCTEFASDALIDNDVSHQAHRATGFSEVERIVCYRKDL